MTRWTPLHLLLASALQLVVVQSVAAQGPTASAAVDSPTISSASVSPVTAGAALDQVAQRDDAVRPFELALGTSYASGDFGTADKTRIWSTALSARYASGGLRISGSIPYMRIRSRGTIFTGIDSTPVVVAAAGGARKRTTDGIGDLTLGASYALPAMPGGVELELSGRIKLPTASRSSELSNRQVDYSLGAQVTKTIGTAAPFVSVGYRILGDPRAIRLRNGVSASAGSSFVVDDRTVLLASYHFAQKASRLISDGHELFAGASRLLGDRLRLTGYATAGLSNGAAGVSAGASLAFRL